MAKYGMSDASWAWVTFWAEQESALAFLDALDDDGAVNIRGEGERPEK